MKKKLTIWLVLLLALSMIMTFSSCGKKEAEEESAVDEAVTEQVVEEGPAVVKTIDEIDADENDFPLQIISISLFEDGSVLLVPDEDLRRNEMKDDEDGEGIYPFEEFGKVKDIGIYYYGNAGYRTVIALMEDGTICAVNGGALIEDHIVAVMPNIGGRDNFVSVENSVDESAHYIVGHTEDGEDVVLDYSMNLGNQ